MIKHDPNFVVPVQLPLDFWMALQVVRNHVFEHSHKDYFNQALKPLRGGFYDSINVVDTYLHQFHWWAHDQSKKSA